MVFKVPTLKNIAESAPYFHDGSAKTLEEAIRLMGHHQLGIDLTKDEVDAMAAWMRSMTGDPDPAYVAAPPAAARLKPRPASPIGPDSPGRHGVRRVCET